MNPIPQAPSTFVRAAAVSLFVAGLVVGTVSPTWADTGATNRIGDLCTGADTGQDWPWRARGGLSGQDWPWRTHGAQVGQDWPWRSHTAPAAAECSR